MARDIQRMFFSFPCHEPEHTKDWVPITLIMRGSYGSTPYGSCWLVAKCDVWLAQERIATAEQVLGRSKQDSIIFLYERYVIALAYSK